MPNMKALSLTVKNIYTMLKSADGQTNRQTEGETDNVITYRRMSEYRSIP